MDMKSVERVRERFLAFESFLITGFSLLRGSISIRYV